MTTFSIIPQAVSDAALVYEKIGPDGYDSLRAIAFKTFDETFSPTNPPHVMKAYMDKAFSQEQLLDELRDSKNLFYLVKQDNAVVGYFKLTAHPHDNTLPAITQNHKSIMLERFYLDSAFHGNGIAHAMMQECIHIAKEMEFGVIWLGVWEKNHRARRFYEKWGFEPAGTHIFMMGEEAQTDLWLARII